MKARYVDIDARVDEGQLRISAKALNKDRQAWPAGSSVGRIQVLDAGAERLVAEHPGEPLHEEQAAGQSVDLDLAIALPEEGGRYRVVVSPSEPAPNSGLVVVEASDEGARGEAITRRQLSARRFRRSLGRAFVYPWLVILGNLSLIRTMVKRDIASRYAGSFGGAFWTVIQPVLLMATYSFVFGVILRTRFGDDGRPSNFILYFLAGLLPWLALSEAVGRAPTVILEHANFVKKLVFPIGILPVNLTVAGLFSQTLATALFLALMLTFGRTLEWTVLLLPLLLIPQVLLTLGLGWFFSALGVVFRDLGQLMGFLMTLWFFTTPICYPEASLEGYLWIFDKNPMYVLVSAYRSVLLEGAVPDLVPLGVLTAASLASVILGYAWFHRMKPSFPDLV